MRKDRIPGEPLSPLKYMRARVLQIPQKQISFSALEVVFWAMMASTGLFSLYLQSKGMSADQVGTVMAAVAFIAMISPPIWGVVSDKLRSARRVFIIMIVAAALLLLTVPPLVSRFSILAACIMIPFARFFFGPTAILDSWLVRTVSADRRLSYGSIRMFGCIGYAAAAVAYTALIERFSSDVIFYGYALLMIPTALLAMRTKDDHEAGRRLAFKEMKIGSLLRNVPFIAFLLFNLALYMPINASFSFIPFLIESVGEDPAVFGTIIGIKALMEMPLFLLSGRLVKRFHPTKLLIATACVYTLEMLLYPFCTNLTQIFIVQLMHGSVFGLYLTCQIQYVHSLAPKELTATAQTIAGASTALSSIIGNLFGGFMIKATSLGAFFFVSGLIQAGAVILFMIHLRMRKGASNHAKE